MGWAIPYRRKGLGISRCSRAAWWAVKSTSRVRVGHGERRWGKRSRVFSGDALIRDPSMLEQRQWNLVGIAFSRYSICQQHGTCGACVRFLCFWWRSHYATRPIRRTIADACWCVDVLRAGAWRMLTFPPNWAFLSGMLLWRWRTVSQWCLVPLMTVAQTGRCGSRYGEGRPRLGTARVRWPVSVQS